MTGFRDVNGALIQHVSNAVGQAETNLTKQVDTSQAALKTVLESQLATTERRLVLRWLGIVIGQIVVVTSIATIYLMFAARQ